MKHYTTHHMHRDSAQRLAPSCGAILGQHGAGAMDADPDRVDCRPCLARLELREKLARARQYLTNHEEHVPTAAGEGSYWLRRAAELAEQATDAARRAGMLTDERAPLKLDSTGPMVRTWLDQLDTEEVTA